MAVIDGNLGLLPGDSEAKAKTQRQRLPIAVVLAALYLLVLLVAVIYPSLLARDQPLAINTTQTFLGPSLHHLFGTDQSGRDVFSRVIYGARSSLSIGVAATALALAAGSALGLLAGLGGRFLDVVIGRVLDVLFAFPGILLALLFIVILGANVTTLILAVGLGTVPGYARMIRGQVISVRDAPFVEAAAVLGHTRWRVITRTIFPNAMRPLVVLATLGVGQSIVFASSLSFLGLGTAPPAPEWGAMLSAGRDYVATAWWLEFFPGAVIVLFTLATTALGRHLQRHFEGKDAA